MTAPGDGSVTPAGSGMDDSPEALREAAEKAVTDSAVALRAYAVPIAAEPVTEYRPRNNSNRTGERA